MADKLNSLSPPPIFTVLELARRNKIQTNFTRGQQLQIKLALKARKGQDFTRRYKLTNVKSFILLLSIIYIYDIVQL